LRIRPNHRAGGVELLIAEAVSSTPEEFLELSRRETVKWDEVVRISGAKLD